MEQTTSRIVSDAIQAFFAELAKQCPDITTGDLSPVDTENFEQAATEAAQAWIRGNTTAPTFRTEFAMYYAPTADELKHIALYELTDSSWRNNAAPSWTDADERIELFVDALDPADREIPEAKRFIVFDSKTDRTLYEGDELDYALGFFDMNDVQLNEYQNR